MTPQSSKIHELLPSEARSWLVIPALNENIICAARTSDSDVVVLDLEDGVLSADKIAARQCVSGWLEHHPGWVRISDACHPNWQLDLEALDNVQLAGIVLSKTESPEQVSATAAQAPASVQIVALIESAAGLAAADSIAAHPAVSRLGFGVGDFRRDTGIGSSTIALAYARSRLVIASRAAGIAGPIDGPTTGRDAAALREASLHSVEMGMTGKFCLRADDAAVINKSMSPSPEDLDWAAAVFRELGEKGDRIADGSDLPRLATAHSIRDRAVLFHGAQPSDRLA